MRIKDELAGKRVRCPCGEVLRVPQPEPPPDDGYEVVDSAPEPEKPKRRLKDGVPDAPPDREKDVGGWGGMDDAPPDREKTRDADGWGDPDEAPSPPRPKKRKARTADVPASPGGIGEYLYWLLPLALLPLAFSLLSHDADDTKQRFVRTLLKLEEAPPDVQHRVQQAMERTRIPV